MPQAATRPEHYLADKPVSTSAQDEFKRYGFAKRIAETIRDRQSPESLVVGLYGRWGEGKTSVLNFITTELKSASIITVTFNPWRFEGEEQLLLGFFAELARALKKPLKTKGQQAGELLAHYAEAIIPKFEFFDGAVSTEPGTQLKKIGELLASAPLHELKERLEGLLLAARKRVVIIIDDIDRLNKQEIQAIFRLVKLTGDFNYTTYLLSFDNDMVARAIGEMYGGGDEGAGHSFLEKIIQVPLHLPSIQSEVMLRFFLEQINIVLSSTKTDIAKEDADRFARAAQESIIPMITVPRHVIRYCNALSFLLPLLHGEVNSADMMLIEALKIFYPQLHEFIAGKQSAVTGIHQDSAGDAHIKSQLDPILNEKSVLLGTGRALIYALFPKVSGVYNRAGLFSSSRSYRDEAEMEKKKLIASRHYFKRYFSYAVQPGEIADIHFDAFLNSIFKGDETALFGHADELLKHNDFSELLRRIIQSAKDIPAESAANICKLIGRFSHKIDFDSSPIGWHFGAAYKGILFIFSLLAPLTPASRLNIAITLIRDSTSFRFCQTLLHEILVVTAPYKQRDPDTGETILAPALFTEHDYQQLAKALMNRALTEAGTSAFFDASIPDCEELILYIWPKASSPQAIQKYIQTRLDQYPKELLLLLRSISSKVSTNGGPYLPTHISDKKYLIIREVMDAQYLYDIGLTLLNGKTINPPEDEMKTKMTDMDRLHQFMQHHEQYLANQKSSEGESSVEIVS